MRLSVARVIVSRVLMLVALLLGGGGAIRAVENNTPPTPSTPGTTYDYNCNNKHFTCSRSSGYCEPCGETSSGESWKCNETSGSVLNNAALWHTHVATDYATSAKEGLFGCVSCGAASRPAIGALPGLTLGRIHNYAFTGEHSSFGPGVYSSYDVSLELSTVGYSWTNYGKRTIRVVDPASGPFVESTYDFDWTQPDFTTTPVLTRVDATVDFDWGTGSPGAGVPVDGFAVRWSGTVIPTASETYTFFTTGDDGVRLWVNGQLLVDKWKDQGAVEYSGTIALTAGVPVSIRMEYYENTGNAVAKLSWSSTSTPKAVIPSTALRTAANAPGLDAIFVTSYGAEDGIYYDNDPYGGRVFSVYKDVRLYNASNALTTDQSVATKAVVTKLSGNVQTFAVFRTSTSASTTERFARLVSWADRNGNAQTFSYVYPITTDPAQAGGDLNKLWMLSTITDAYSRVATVTYRTTQVAGRWVIDHIAVPNGSTISYQYNTGAGLIGLSGVTYPDGTASTFSGAVDGPSQCQVIHYNDAGAEPTHRRKDVYLTTATWTDPVTSQVISQPVGRARLVMNGAGEATWYSQTYTQPNGTQSHLIYEGGQRMMRMDFSTVFDGKPQRIYHASVFNFGTDPSTWTWELEAQNVTMDAWYRVTGTKDALGRSTSYQVDATTGNITKTTFPDASFSTATFDQYQQALHQVDRLGRVTDSVYSTDNKGNRIEQRIAVGTADAAIWKWDYNAKGQVLNAYDAEYLAAYPDLHVTSCTYNSAGYLVNLTAAADVSGQPRPTTSFEYDAAGRLTKSTDPEGRKAIYTYDLRNRVQRIDYDDASYESITYGTGTNANLVTDRRDRNGNVTTFVYDLHGRLVTKTEASGTSVAGVSTFTYLTGTDKISVATVLGETTTTGYDFRNRIVTVNYTPRSDVTLTTTTSYDNAQRVAWTQDVYGRKTYPVYDLNDRVIRTVRELVPGAIAGGTNLSTLARVTTANPPYVISDSTYDAMGQQLSTIDGRGITTSFAYDGQGRMWQQIQASAAPSPLVALAYKTEFSYDKQGNQLLIKHPRTFTEAAAFQTAMTYTGRNLLKTTTEAVGRTEQATRSRTYTPTGKTKTDTDFNGNVTTMAYYPCCDRLYTVTDPAGGLITYTYDGYGNVTSVTDANGNTAATTYDARLRVATVTQVQENETTTYAYDDNGADATGLSSTYASQLTGLGLAAGSDGSLVEITDPLGHATVQVRDGVGRVVKMIDSLGHATTMTYDAVVGGLVETTATDALAHVTKTGADGAGRVRVSTDALAQQTLMGYDANGNRISARDPNGVGMDCLYDAANRETQCTQTRSDVATVTSSVYDAHDNRTQQKDALLKITTCVYDARDRKTSCTDRLTTPSTTYFLYDNNRNLMTITDGEGKVTTYTYNSRDLLASELYPTGQATPGAVDDLRSYTYDAGRRLATRTDQAGVVTTYQYDHANRLTQRQYPDSQNDLFAYDHAGRLTKATSQRFGTVVDRAYDNANRLTTETQTAAGYAYAVGYGYTNDNQVQTLTYPNGKQVIRFYTDRHQLATVSYDGSSVATRTYDNSGRLTSTVFPNTLTETRTYIPGDNLVASIGVPGVTNFSGYVYDANKRKTYEGHQFNADLQTFGYDNENRVTAWTRDGVESQAWTLSAVGDWQSTTRNGTTQTRTHSNVHETTGITIGAVTTPLTYDKKGNLTTDEQGQGYGWDVENRLFASVVGAATNGYAYDALGRRLAKAAGGVVTTFVHDGAQVIAEYEAPVYQSADIGGPTLAGSFSDSGSGTITVSGSGADIWNNADQFRYAYFTLTGDGSITAQVTTQTNTDAWAKAGVMLRDSLAAGAKQASVFITPGNGVAFQRRLATGGASTNNQTGAGTAATPIWLRLTRSGTTVSGYRSADAVTWTLVASDTIAFSQPTIYAGLAVTSHTNAAVSTATFTHVMATGTLGTSSSSTYARGYVYGSYVDEVLAILPASGLAADRKFVHSNHLYSVAALTDNAGAVVERYRYDAYGQRTTLAADGVTIRTSSSYGNQIGFTGRYLDKETGLMYFRSRYEDPQIGRFLNRMPWFGMNNLKMTNYSIVTSEWYGLITSTLNVAQGSYIQQRYNLYDFMFDDPANTLEPFSCGWQLAGAGGGSIAVGAGTGIGTAAAGLVAAVNPEIAVAVVGAGLILLYPGEPVDDGVSQGESGPEWPPVPKKAKDAAKEREKDKRKCLPCSPVVGTLAYETHRDHTHFPCMRTAPCGHAHVFKMNQSPPKAGCKCFWDRNFTPVICLGANDPDPQPVVTPAAGGGIAP